VESHAKDCKSRDRKKRTRPGAKINAESKLPALSMLQIHTKQTKKTYAPLINDNNPLPSKNLPINQACSLYRSVWVGAAAGFPASPTPPVGNTTLGSTILGSAILGSTILGRSTFGSRTLGSTVVESAVVESSPG
jgi:hypothetical protein